MSATTRCSIVAVAVVVFLAAAAAVHAQIYVTNGDTGTVGAYKLDGTPINAALITGLQHPQGLAVSDGYIYVATSDFTNSGGTIGKYTTSGATVNAALLSGLPSPLHGIAVSGNDLYVAQEASGGWVGKYTTSGATIDSTFVRFTQTLSDPFGLAVSGTDLLVTNEILDYVGHFTTAGATIDEQFIDAGSGSLPYALAVSGSTIFVSQQGGYVSSYTTSGVPIDFELIPYLPGATGIGVLGDRLFVESASFGTVGTYKLDGTPVNTALISGLGLPTGIAVVPEPGGIPLLGLALPALLRRRRPATAFHPLSLKDFARRSAPKSDHRVRMEKAEVITPAGSAS